jgi:hypothetical protein
MFSISLLKNSEVSPEKTIDVHSLAIETLWILWMFVVDKGLSVCLNVSSLHLIICFWNVLLLWSTLLWILWIMLLCTQMRVWMSLCYAWSFLPEMFQLFWFRFLWILWMLLFALYIWELEILEFEGSKLCGERKIGQESSIKPCSSRRIFKLIAHWNLPSHYAIDGKTDV